MPSNSNHITQHARALTHVLVFTAGCNVLVGNPVLGGGSIASSLILSTYALGPASGVNFNPTVSVPLGITKKMDWLKVGEYCGVQLLSGLGVTICYSVPFNITFNLGPTENYTW